MARRSKNKPTGKLTEPESISSPLPEGNTGDPLPEGNSLPDFPGIQWEWKDDGSAECWATPRPTAPRKERTYLKRAGKRLLQEWATLPREEREKVIGEWVSLARMSKPQRKQNNRRESGNL